MEENASRSLDHARALTRAQFTNSLGDGAFYVTSALFFTQVVGLAPTQVGVGLTCAWSLGFLSSAPIGQVADRLGPRETAVALSVVTAVAICGLAVARSFPMFLLAAGCYAVAQSGLGAVRQALVVHLVPVSERLQARARMQVAVNAGLGAGAAAGGLALLTGVAGAYLVVLFADAVAFLAAAALLLRLPRTQPPRNSSSVAARGSLAVLSDHRYVAAAAFNAVLYLYMPVLSVVAPLWIAKRTVAPLWTVGVLFVLNTVGVMALQRVAAHRVTDLPSAASSVRRGGCLLGGGCLVLGIAAVPGRPAAATTVLLLGGAILTLGEVLLAAGSWEIAFTLADPSRPGEWQGLYSSGLPAARALGPSALVALVLAWSGPGWWVLGGLFAVAGLALGSTAYGGRSSVSGRRWWRARHL